MKKRRAVFLDRDGTIIRQVNDLHRWDQVRLLPHAADGIRILNKLGFVVLVVSNQPIVARGRITEADVKELHEKLCARLARRGAHIDGVYFCPHHPNANVKKYRKVCACRKPNPGMFLAGARKFDVDLKGSYTIGDHSRDILAGKKAGVTTILLTAGQAGKDALHDVRADVEATTLYAAARTLANARRRGGIDSQ